MKSLAGFVGYLRHVQVDWTLGAVIALSAAGGTVIGTLLLRRISPESLRRVFGWFVLAMAVFILGQQLPGATLDSFRVVVAAHWLLITGSTLIGLLGLLAYRARRRHG